MIAPKTRWLDWRLATLAGIIVAGLFLPAALYAGYGLTSFELAALLFIAAIMGCAVAPLLASRTGAGIFATLSLSLVGDLYFAGSLGVPIVMALLALGVVGIGSLTFWRPSIGLGIAAAVQFSQLASAIVLRPATEFLVEISSKSGTAPSVIHVVLDEHGSIDAMPSNIVSEVEKNELIGEWERLGFSLFRQVYTAEAATYLTIARMWNPQRKNPDGVVVRSDGPETFLVEQFDMAREVTARRALDVTGMNYVSLRPILKSQAPINRLLQRDYPRATVGITAAHLPQSDRLRILLARMADWHVKSAKSNLVRALGDATGMLHRDGGLLYSWRSAYGLTAKYELDQLANRLACCGIRSTYYYVHVLLPHWPYVFHSDCRARPVATWLYNEVHELGRPNTLATRAERYRLYLDQVRCTQRVIARLVSAVDSNPSLTDAIIMIHGDHGARIALKPVERANIPESGYDDTSFQLDQRATLFALRQPGRKSQSEWRPVRLDALIQALWASEFASSEAAFAREPTESPYRKRGVR